MGLAAELGGGITGLGEEAATASKASRWAETLILNALADLELLLIGADGEAPTGLGTEKGLAATKAGRTMSDPRTNSRALKSPAKTGLKVGVSRCNTRTGTDTGHDNLLTQILSKQSFLPAGTLSLRLNRVEDGGWGGARDTEARARARLTGGRSPGYDGGEQ